MSTAFRSSAVVAASLALPAALLTTAAASAETVLRLSHGYELTNPHHIATVAAAEHVQTCTNGSVRIDIYPASQLGNEAAMNDQVKFGGIDIIQTGLLWASRDHPPIGVNALPYLFRDRQHAAAYQKSDVMKELMDGYNQATGLHMLAVGYHGAFNVSSRGKPINGLADLQGMKVRVPDTALFMAFPRSVGANPTPIPFAEVYLGLQQGVADASVNPLPVTYSHKLYEVQDYVALTEHLVEFIAWVVSDPAWQQLDEAERACLQEGADIFAELSAEGNIEMENTLRERMSAEGLIEFTTPDKAEFIEATENARRELMAEYGWSDELVERIRSIQ
jgi:tripartite ATP-independent transporter DctP family solute receptor